MVILGIAMVMNYSGATQTLGLALANTGVLFPLFSAYIGWSHCRRQKYSPG